MPYLKLSSKQLPIETRRELARALTAVTLETLHLSNDDRNRTTIQFFPYDPENFAIGGRLVSDGEEPDYTLEIRDNGLTMEKKLALTKAFNRVLAQCLGSEADPLDMNKVTLIFRNSIKHDIAIGGQFLSEHDVRRNLLDKNNEVLTWSSMGK